VVPHHVRTTLVLGIAVQRWCRTTCVREVETHAPHVHRDRSRPRKGIDSRPPTGVELATQHYRALGRSKSAIKEQLAKACEAPIASHRTKQETSRPGSTEREGLDASAFIVVR
jgi:hypothetical protein